MPHSASANTAVMRAVIFPWGVLRSNPSSTQTMYLSFSCAHSKSSLKCIDRRVSLSILAAMITSNSSALAVSQRPSLGRLKGLIEPDTSVSSASPTTKPERWGELTWCRITPRCHSMEVEPSESAESRRQAR